MGDYAGGASAHGTLLSAVELRNTLTELRNALTELRNTLTELRNALTMRGAVDIARVTRAERGRCSF